MAHGSNQEKCGGACADHELAQPSGARSARATYAGAIARTDATAKRRLETREGAGVASTPFGPQIGQQLAVKRSPRGALACSCGPDRQAGAASAEAPGRSRCAAHCVATAAATSRQARTSARTPPRSARAAAAEGRLPACRRRPPQSIELSTSGRARPSCPRMMGSGATNAADGAARPVLRRPYRTDRLRIDEICCNSATAFQPPRDFRNLPPPLRFDGGRNHRERRDADPHCRRRARDGSSGVAPARSRRFFLRQDRLDRRGDRSIAALPLFSGAARPPAPGRRRRRSCLDLAQHSARCVGDDGDRPRRLSRARRRSRPSSPRSTMRSRGSTPAPSASAASPTPRMSCARLSQS